MISLSEGTVNFIGGGVAGAVSRTVVSPFERIKIILQVQKKSSIDSKFNSSIWSSLKNIYKSEGWAGMFRGNGLNCLRIFPYSAVQFIVYQNSMYYLYGNGISTSKKANMHTVEMHQQLVSGALCGFASIYLTYPMDLIRTRLSIQTANLAILPSNTTTATTVKSNPPGFIALFKQVWLSEGRIKGLYKGVIPTCFGVVPYVALNFTIYERLKQFTNTNSNLLKLTIGALSGGLAQTLVYPFDLLRRRFQVINIQGNNLGYHYTSIPNALYCIGKYEGGFKAYYNGLSINLFKVVPSTAVSWLVYEISCDMLRDL